MRFFVKDYFTKNVAFFEACKKSGGLVCTLKKRVPTGTLFLFLQWASVYGHAAFNDYLTAVFYADPRVRSFKVYISVSVDAYLGQRAVRLAFSFYLGQPHSYTSNVTIVPALKESAQQWLAHTI